MSRSVFTAPHFNDEAAAYAYIEARLWADGRVCPKCGVVDRSGPLKGKSNRIGLYKCYACRKPFTVKVGTIFEDSHIQMRDWLVAIHLLCASKKGISSNQLHRSLGITLKSAWCMSHRIRAAMSGHGNEPMGGEGAHIEADEVYYGNKPDREVRRGTGHKRVVVSLVERGGSVRSFHVDTANIPTVRKIIDQNVDKASTLNTDEGAMYTPSGKEFAKHQVVHHGNKEYVRGDAYTNTIEGYFSIFKRGMVGVYQRCDEKHLHRYLSEFDFRYSARIALGVDDTARATKALKGVVGKRLTYRRINGEGSSLA